MKKRATVLLRLPLAPYVWIVTGLAAIIVVGGIDYVTGPELSFSVFYLFPIALLAWFVGPRTGVVAAGMSTVVWFLADILEAAPYSNAAIPYWNAAVRLGVFLTVALTVSSLRLFKQRQEDLVHLIVHDLRAPLSNVMMGLQLLQTSPDAQQRKLVEMSLASCQWMLRLINAMLDLARLENDQMPLHITDVRIRELVETAFEQVRLWAEQTPVRLNHSLDAGTPETVRADADVTVRVLTNLLSNAIKFSPPEATVMVHVAPAPQGNVTFSITDQGQGVPEEWAEKVFDKYTQIDPHKKAGLVGSGLGLVFCREAINAQHGQIWLKSEADRGTTVTFTLPAGNGIERNT